MSTATTTIAKPLLGKVKLLGVIRAQTGLHIGGAEEVLEIGAVDAYVVRDPVTRDPYVPGSSLKGKLRSLFEREQGVSFNRPIGRRGAEVQIHVCDTTEDAFNCAVCRLFGSSGYGEGNEGKNFPARLKVRDAPLFLYTREKLLNAETDLWLTELKFENALDRVTAAATPRKIERVPPGSDFRFELVYDVESFEHLEDDLNNLFFALQLLEDDALGGHGSRGSGKVQFFVYDFQRRKIESYRQDASGASAPPFPLSEPNQDEDVDKLKSLMEAKEQVSQVVSFFRP